MSLKNCIDITSNLNDQDVDNILESYDSYVEFNPQARSARLAIDDAILSVEQERQETLELIYDTHPDLAPTPLPAVTVPNNPAFSMEVKTDSNGKQYVQVRVDPELMDYDADNFGIPKEHEVAPEGDPRLEDTQKKFTIPGSQHPELKPGKKDYLAPRKRLHEKWLKEELARGETPPPGTMPVAILTGGGGASGKGTVVEQEKDTGWIPDLKYVEADPDRPKTKMNEFLSLVRIGDSRAAPIVHEESSDMTTILIDRAIKQKKNIIIDKTMNDPAKVKAQIEQLRKEGYEIRMIGVVTDIDIAMTRALGRFYGSGRMPYVPAMTDAHVKFNRFFEDHAKLVDKAIIVDNSGKKPVEFMSAEQGVISIIDPMLYNRAEQRGNLSEKASTLRQVHVEAAPIEEVAPADRRGMGSSDRAANAEGVRGDTRGTEEAPERLGPQPQPGEFVQRQAPIKTKPKKSVTVSSLRRTIALMQRDNPGTRRITFHIAATQEEAFGPGSVARDGIIKGGFYSGSEDMVLIAENIKDFNDAMTSIRHEVVGHYGLRQLLNGEGQYDRLLNRVYRARNGELKDLYEWVEQFYPELVANNDARTIADEMLARAAETKTDTGLLTRIYDEIIKLLNKLGFGGDISRAEVYSLIRSSERNLRRKTPFGTGLAEGGQVAREQQMMTRRLEQSEYDQAVAKGLAMTQEARDRRAKNMGFDMDAVYYHATQALGKAEDFTAFEPTADRPFVFVSEDPNFADKWNDDTFDDMYYKDFARIMPLRVRKGKTFDFAKMSKAEEKSLGKATRQAAIKRHMDLWRQLQGEKVAADTADYIEEWGLPEFHYGLKNKTAEEAQSVIESFVDEVTVPITIKNVKEGIWQEIEGDLDYVVAGGTFSRPATAKDQVTLNWMKDQGYESFFVEEFVPGAGRQRTLAVMNPNQVRSINAAFDPTFKASGNLLRQAGDQTDTPAFKNWFGDSKVVDDQGKPLVVYHGAGRAFTVFNPQNSFTTGGDTLALKRVKANFFTSSRSVAEGFAEGSAVGKGAKETVVNAYLSLQNPLIIDGKGGPWRNYSDQVVDAYKGSKYDGVIVKNVEDGFFEGEISDVYVAFKSEQNKSTTDNSGAFDPTNPDIRFRRAADEVEDAPVGAALGMPDETITDKFVRLAQNSFNRVKKLQETITEQGGTVRLESDVYGTEERSSSKIADRLKQLDKGYMKPLLEIMDQNKISIEELDNFLIAKHAKERNAYIASINDAMPDGGSGMTNQQAEDILTMAGERRAVLERAAQVIYAVNENHLDDLVEGGHLDQATVDGWRERWDYYVPLKGKAGEEGRPRPGSGFSIKGAGIQKALGRGTGNIAESPTAHSFAQAESAIVRTEKTKVGQALVELVRDNPDPEFWNISKRTYKKFEDLYGEPFEGYDSPPEGLIENIDYHRVKNSKGKVVYALDPNYKQRDDVFAVMVKGEELLIKINDKVLMEQLKRMNTTQLNAVVAGFGTVNRYLAMINTALNPEFVITNFERDFQTAMVNLGGEHSAAIAAKVMKNIPGAIRGIWQSTFDTSGQSEWRALFNEMEKEGGTIGFFGLEDINTKVKKIQNRLADRHGVLGRTKKGIAAVRDVVLDANLSVENAARLAAYKVIKDESMANGMSEKEAKARAASVAKNLTVNFNRKGELAPVLNSAYLFYNASIQGSARIFTALKSPRVRKIVGGIMATSFALAMYNRNAGGDDEDEIAHWDKISDYTKQTNLIIMHPDGSGNFTKVRLPYGYNVFYYAGTAMHDMMFDPRKTAAGTTMNMLSAMMNAFNPIQGADFLDTVTPTFLKPYEQDARNINFMEAPLKPENPFDNYDRPESQKAFKSTNPQLVELLQAINKATGGDQTHSGLIDISPEIVKHYVGWLTGGAGLFGTRAIGTAINLATDQEIDMKNVPFLRTLGGKPGSHFDTERFYDAVKEVNAVEAQLKLLKGTEDYADYKADNSEVHRLSFHMNRYKNKIKRLREARDKAYADDDRTLAEEKREAMRLEMMEFSQKYDEAVAAQ
jgi:predicted ABC-type ATPase